MLSPIKPAVRRARDAAGRLYGVVRHIATSWAEKALAAFLAPRMLPFTAGMLGLGAGMAVSLVVGG
jgi:hypothetical protein